MAVLETMKPQEPPPPVRALVLLSAYWAPRWLPHGQAAQQLSIFGYDVDVPGLVAAYPQYLRLLHGIPQGMRGRPQRRVGLTPQGWELANHLAAKQPSQPR